MCNACRSAYRRAQHTPSKLCECGAAAMPNSTHCKPCWVRDTIECQRAGCTRRALKDVELCSSCVVRGFHKCVRCAAWRMEFASGMCRECAGKTAPACTHPNPVLHRDRCVECIATFDHVISSRDVPGGVGMCSVCGRVAIRTYRGGAFCKIWESFKTRAAKYSMTPAELAAMYVRANGACWLCGEPEGDDVLHVDHTHSCCEDTPTCGKCTRELLCNSHNTSLGKFNDDPTLLRRAADYIELYAEGYPSGLQGV
jgi:hypothetical protein